MLDGFDFFVVGVCLPLISGAPTGHRRGQEDVASAVHRRFGAATGKAGAVVVTLFFPLLIDSIGLSATVGPHGRRALTAAVVTVLTRPRSAEQVA